VQVVLITGASSGMGLETAKYLAKQNFKVYAATRNPQKLLHLQEKNIVPITLDVTSPKSVEECVAYILTQEKTIDILINNAGYGLVSSVEDCTEEEMLAQFNVNLFGVLRVCKSVIPVMREHQKGVIINISSFLGKIGLPLLTFYNASKYALEGVTDSLRYELREFNIRVHSILPGFFDTQFARDNLVVNAKVFQENFAYKYLVKDFVPMIVDQINNGNSAKEVAALVLEIIEDEYFVSRVTVGEKAKKFLPMRKELSDEDFERRVREYYSLG